jgi:parallel beta-helix repeat protein
MRDHLRKDLPVYCAVLTLAIGFARAEYSATAGAVTASATAPVADDTFTRTVTNGWGSANVGGVWQVSTPSSAWSARGGAGTVVLGTRGSGYLATLHTLLRDIDGTLTATIANRPSGTGTMVYLLGRHNGLDDYRARIRVASDGTVYAAVLAHVGSTDHLLGREITIPRVRWSATTPIALRFRLSGAAPTALSLRVWNATQAEPPSWDLVTSNNDSHLQRSGTIGAMAYASTTSTGSPSTVRFDNIYVTSGPAPAISYGGAPLGSAVYPIPSRAYYVSTTGKDTNPGTKTAPFRTLGKAVASVPSGSTIVMRAGTYRESVTWYGKALTIEPAPDETVWMSGSDVVTGWVADGAVWRRDNWTVSYNRTSQSDLIDPAYPYAGLPDQIFVDGVPMTQVGSRAAVTAGKFYFDVGGRHLYLGTNPTGQSVEVSTRARAMYINHGNGSVVRGIGIERYATSTASLGAIYGEADNLLFDNDTFRDNAAAGLSVDGDRIWVVASLFDSNGQLGLHGNRLTNSVIAKNRFVGNDAAHFAVTGASGGMKLTTVSNVVVWMNLSERNVTRGMWIDIHSNNVTLVRNVVRDNGDRGIQYEISNAGNIIGNTLVRNGAAGTAVIESTNMQIYNNTFDDNLRGIDVIDGTRSEIVSNVAIRNNLISGTRPASNNLLAVNDVSHHRSAEQMGVSVNYDAYSRENATFPKFLVTWSDYPTTVKVFTSVSDFEAKARQELNGSALDGTSTAWYVNPAGNDFRVAAGNGVLGHALGLPSSLAAVLSVAPGTVLDPGAP